MVYLRIGLTDFTIERQIIKTDDKRIEEFLNRAKEHYVPQMQHQDDPDMLLADYFVNVVGAKVTKYDVPGDLKKALDRGDIL